MPTAKALPPRHRQRGSHLSEALRYFLPFPKVLTKITIIFSVGAVLVVVKSVLFRKI